MAHLDPERDPPDLRAAGERHEAGHVSVDRRVVDRGRHREPPRNRDRVVDRDVDAGVGRLQRGVDEPGSRAAAGVREVDGDRAAVDRERERGRRGEEQRVVGTHEVDQSAALTKHGDLVAPVVADGRSRLDERRLDLRDVHDGCRCCRSATAPETCGAAMLVPDIAPNGPAWFTGRDDVIATPGAATSGLSWSDTGVGPPEEKSAIVPASVVAATVIAERRIRRRADRAVAVLVELVVGRDHRHDAGRCRRVDRRDHEVALRRDLRLAERQVDHVHPVRHRCLDRRRDLRRVPVEPEPGRRDRQRLVVPEESVGRDTREEERAVLGVVVARGDPGDVRRVERPVLRRVEGRSRERVRGRARREHALHDHLRRRLRRQPLREPGRVGERRGVEEDVPGVDAIVDDPDLHALARRCEAGAPELVGPDDLRPLVELVRPGHRRPRHRELVVGDVRPDLGDPRDRREVPDVSSGDDEREPVGHEPIPVDDPGARDRLPQARLGTGLDGGDARLRMGGGQRAGDERGRVERHDDLGRRDRARGNAAARERGDGYSGCTENGEASQSADERT